MTKERDAAGVGERDELEEGAPEESDGENKKTPTANGGGLAARPKGFEPLTF